MTIRWNTETRGGLDLRRCEAVVVDIDGVVADTARVHAEAWKGVFDAFLRVRARRLGAEYGHEEHRPFDVYRDYVAHLSARPRLEGVRSFLESRGVVVDGTEHDRSGQDTARHLGELKDRYLLAHLRRHGVVPYPSTVAFLDDLRARGVPVAAVSADRVGSAVLRAAGLTDVFDDVVVGDEVPGWNSASSLFRTTARRVGLPPEDLAVVSSALPRLEAARYAGFGLVVAVDRRGTAGDMLRRHGADVVVTSLAGIRVVRRNWVAIAGNAPARSA